ncbi:MULTISPECIES: hypothetical protein [Corynebacterium]|uniref:hypothetical protein n=1 Tax=Corynebacterium TaxID=1716 RepID=UPI0008A480C1|nr:MULTISPECIES: hypothetical protein [Corynebacterium]MCT1443077.1 hypothetical protein [Corynebacterium glucuronolyticum]MCT1564291.1 hypothetical protein [Corynebacterium glucuronolyticum]OFO42916.1 hypothetical protein HMPREF3044_05170 [Corynebacterium sp. HMSC073D01]
MTRKVANTLVAGATAFAVAFSTVPAASAADPFGGLGGLIGNSLPKPKNEKIDQIGTLLSSEGKDPVENSDRPIEGQLLDILSSESEADKVANEAKKKEQDEKLKGASSSEKIAYGLVGGKGFSNTTDDAAKSISILLDAGLAIGIVGIILVVLNSAASLVTIGQALPGFGR